MKIYSWNVNGIRAVQKKGFLDWFKKEAPDILCIQETKAQKSQLSDELINMDGYHSYFSSAEKKGYSGVAIYSKEKPKNIETSIGLEEFDREGRVLIAEYDDFTLFNIYFPNGQINEDRLDYKMRFYDHVLDILNGLVKKGKRLVICGDYNTAHTPIDIKNAKANENRSGFLPMERQWIDRFIEKGYVDTFRSCNPQEIRYSWWSYRFKARERNAGWRIDYHFISENLKENVVDAKILDDVTGSDHCPVTLELKFKK